MKQTVTGKYEYRDNAGNLLYWKERIEPGPDGRGKEFRFYHGNRKMGRGSDSIPYNLPDVIPARSVIITEGEKQADVIKSWGLCGTSLDSGAGSNPTEAILSVLAGKRIALLQDNDEAGTLYALKLANALRGKCESLRIVLLPDLPDKGDICDWVLIPGNDKVLLLEIICSTLEWVPPPEEKPVERKKYVGPVNPDSEITPDIIARAKEFKITDLVEVDRTDKICCLVHTEKTPSMAYNRQRNKLHCFGCGANMDSIDVYMALNNANFHDAVRGLQQ